MKSLGRIVIIMIIIMTSCKNRNNTAVTDPDIYYTCSMDPQVVESHPGKCPICHMELTAVRKSAQTKDHEIRLSTEQMKLGNIRLDTIREGAMGSGMLLTGTLSVDPSKTAAVSARASGRIEHLYVKETGKYVEKGQRLYDLYSEELNNAEQEYGLLLKKQQALGNGVVDYSPLIAAAKDKLLRWGLSEAQLKDPTTTPLITFYSTVSGAITELSVKEGDYIAEGGMVIRVADLSVLWVEAQLYATQLPDLDRNGIATIQTPSFPGREIKGRIAFVNPEIDPETRINLVRIEVPNQDHTLQPGMPAYVTIGSQLHKMLTLPSDAVLRNGNTAVVWVETKENTFAARIVETGEESDETLEIKSGLHPGDIVVVSGAYLVQSEYLFRKGSDPMASMKN